MTRLGLTVCVAIAAAIVVGCNAATTYQIIADPEVTPSNRAADAASVALAYLNEQTPEIAAPELHVAPTIDTVIVTDANSAEQFEPGITRSQATANRGRVIWIVAVHGDLLNLHNYPWTESGAPSTHGDIVIDDATLSILGIYPWAPNQTPPGLPVPL